MNKRMIENNRVKTAVQNLFLFFFIILFIFYFIPMVTDASDMKTAGEYEIKAAFLYNFAKFIELPKENLDENSAEIIIGIIGDDPFGKILDETVSGKTVNSKNLVVKRFKTYDEIKSCHILFICSSEQNQLGEILQKLNGIGILTVSDIASFIKEGGMIKFVVKSNKVKFEINLDASQKGGIKISSKLLKIADSVKGSYQPEGSTN